MSLAFRIAGASSSYAGLRSHQCSDRSLMRQILRVLNCFEKLRHVKILPFRYFPTTVSLLLFLFIKVVMLVLIQAK